MSGGSSTGTATLCRLTRAHSFVKGQGEEVPWGIGSSRRFQNRGTSGRLHGMDRATEPTVDDEAGVLLGWLQFHRDALSAHADLDAQVVAGWGSVRWHLAKVLQEYARHNGHADIITERIDGSRGE